MMGLGNDGFERVGRGSGVVVIRRKKYQRRWMTREKKMRVIMIWVMRMRVTTMRVRWMRERDARDESDERDESEREMRVRDGNMSSRNRVTEKYE